MSRNGCALVVCSGHERLDIGWCMLHHAGGHHEQCGIEGTQAQAMTRCGRWFTVCVVPFPSIFPLPCGPPLLNWAMHPLTSSRCNVRIHAFYAKTTGTHNVLQLRKIYANVRISNLGCGVVHNTTTPSPAFEVPAGAELA